MKRRYRTTIGKFMKDLDIMIEAKREEDLLYKMSLYEAMRELQPDIRDALDAAIWSHCKEKAIHTSHITASNAKR
jgi:hypothetical protein